MDRAAEASVRLVVEQIPTESPLLVEMERNGKIVITPTMYALSTGVVEYL